MPGSDKAKSALGAIVNRRSNNGYDVTSTDLLEINKSVGYEKTELFAFKTNEDSGDATFIVATDRRSCKVLQVFETDPI